MQHGTVIYWFIDSVLRPASLKSGALYTSPQYSVRTALLKVSVAIKTPVMKAASHERCATCGEPNLSIVILRGAIVDPTSGETRGMRPPAQHTRTLYST